MSSNRREDYLAAVCDQRAERSDARRVERVRIGDAKRSRLMLRGANLPDSIASWARLHGVDVAIEADGCVVASGYGWLRRYESLEDLEREAIQ